MQMRLRPAVVTIRRDETPFGGVEIELRRRPVNIRLVRGSASSRLVHNVHRITLSQEELGPTFTAVRCTGKVSPGLSSPMNHDNRPWMRPPAGDLELGVKVPRQYA